MPGESVAGIVARCYEGPSARSPCVVFDDVSLSVADRALVRGISFTISDGAPTIVLGPNGAGKTTLLKLAMGLVEPTGGVITHARQLRRSFVFPRPVMLRRSAIENLAFARAAAGMPANRDAIRSLLDLVGLAHLAGRPARTLSGGEQQRLALARALAREPGILFLDEPTANLDPSATKLIEDLIQSLATSGVKIIMSTHDLGQARRLAADVIFLASGKALEHAPASRFFHQPATEAARRFLAGDLVF